MDHSLSRYNDLHNHLQPNQTQEAKMSILTMPAPAPYPAFRNDLSWDSARASSDFARSRTEPNHVALPSIRQTFPDLHLEVPLANTALNRLPAHKAPLPVAGSLTSPEYVHSPCTNKKRRISNEDEQEFLRAKQVPRLYCNPDALQSRQLSPRRDEAPPFGGKDPWAASPSRSDSYTSHATIPASTPVNDRADPRPDLSSIPSSLKLGRDAPPLQRLSEVPTELVKGSRPSGTEHIPPTIERASYQSQEYGYAYQHPSRFQSLSTSSIRSYDRPPFSAGAAYGSPYSDMARYSDIGSIGIGVDAKQRKRRGNLPKETTDKLRSWFVAHLQHPYPTEDEKQDLMRQTGLQMNQISNWFINARRRQLPAMINNARAESDAMKGRCGGGNGDSTVLVSTERGPDYVDKRDSGLPLSDGEGSGYDDDMNNPHHRTATDRLSV